MATTDDTMKVNNIRIAEQLKLGN